MEPVHLTRLYRAGQAIERLAALAEESRAAGPPPQRVRRNWWTRFLDAGAIWMREHVPLLHWIGAGLFALVFFAYARLLALTVRLVPAGTRAWPDLPAPCVLVVWHGSAPSLLAAIARQPPTVPLAIMVAADPRGDALAMICRMMGMRVLRGHSGNRGWKALTEMAAELERPACAILTPDGGGPAHYAKPGAVALASASGAPLLALGAEAKPALAEPHKWDAPRNPLPWSRIGIAVSEPVSVPEISDSAALEDFRVAMQRELDGAASRAQQALLQRTARSR
jgi:lysophospholipid acyltransferase (LPLAT)-like uncharacterized protein